MTDDQRQRRVRLITSVELSEGYYDRRGWLAVRRDYEIVRDNGDGTYVVRDPEPPKEPST